MRVKSTEDEFIKKLKMSSNKMKTLVKEINYVGLLVQDLTNKNNWKKICKTNEKKIIKQSNSDLKFKVLILDILSSRMDLYKSWYPNLNKKDYIDLIAKQGAEYATMGEIFNKKLKNPVVFGLDHPKMGYFYNLNTNIPVLYAKPRYV